MTRTYKLWILRLTSIPALFYFPIACVGIGIAVSRENRGDSFPLLSLLCLLGGLVAAGVFSRHTLFARIDGSLKRGFWVLVSIALFRRCSNDDPILSAMKTRPNQALQRTR